MKKILFFAFSIIAAAVNAQLKLAKIFTDNMLLQQQQSIPVWGKGIPGNPVQIIFGKEKRQTIVGNDSSWHAYLTKRNASATATSLFIYSGIEKVIIKNILIGDVWLCIGQSNMEFPMVRELHYKDEIKNSIQPLIRFYNPSYAGKNIFGVSYPDSIVQLLNTNDFYKGEWQNCDSASFKNMSAVAYFFGKNIIEKTTIPIGLINLSIGGAPLETFIDVDALKNDARFADKVKGDWIENKALPVWVRERGKQNVSARQNIPTDTNGKNHAYKPGFAFTAGIATLVNIPIKGIICYQGESNAQEIERVNEYQKLCALMVSDYRKKWKQPLLPFYYVQLSSIDTAKYKSALWPQFRDEQRKMMNIISNSGMAVCSDIGAKDDVHPTNKKDVGERLAKWALNKTYGINSIPSGPLPLSAKYVNGKIIVSFQYAEGLKAADQKLLKGFSTDGKTDVAAIVVDKKIVVAVKEKPSYIYYAWKPFTEANLVNAASLPASSFQLKVQ